MPKFDYENDRYILEKKLKKARLYNQYRDLENSLRGLNADSPKFQAIEKQMYALVAKAYKV